MTEKELDKILASVLGKEPSVEKERPPRKKTGGKGARAPKKDHTEADREAKANASIPKNEEKKERKGKQAKGEEKSSHRPSQKPYPEKGKRTEGKNGKKESDARTVKNEPPVRAKKGASAKKDAPHKGGAKGKSGIVRIIPLGGLEEIGKNVTVLESERDLIILDCGMGFPDEDMPGVDLVIPDFSYLEKNRDKVRGIFLTHGHEDHIGSVPYLLKRMNVPVWGTRLTLGILRKRLEEFRYEKKPDLRTVEAGDVVRVGDLAVEFIHVNHSIADSCALAIDTPAGKVVHSGDFKLDVSPIDGQMMDLARFGKLGEEGVELLLCESTNAERPGFTPSERSVGGTLERIFSAHKDKRLVVATFSSNVHRVQQIIDCSVRHGRRVAVLGRSMVNVIGAARDLGYMDVPDGVLVDVSELSRFKPEQITLVTTGSQGEPMSALYRMAFGEHDRIKLGASDLVVLSSSAIPGNEKLVGNIVNALIKSGIAVMNDSSMQVHVSGHACSEELKLLHALIKPKYFMPIHGESRHLHAHKQLAEYMGMPADRIFVSSLGRVLELDGAHARLAETVPAGNVLVDGSGIGDVGAVVLRERKQLAEDGLVVVSVTVDRMSGTVVSAPDILSSGFVYVKESGELLSEARELVRRTVESMAEHRRGGVREMKTRISEELSRMLFKKTKRKPMVLVVISEF